MQLAVQIGEFAFSMLPTVSATLQPYVNRSATPAHLTAIEAIIICLQFTTDNHPDTVWSKRFPAISPPRPQMGHKITQKISSTVPSQGQAPFRAIMI